MRAMGWCEQGPAVVPVSARDGVVESHWRSPLLLGAGHGGVFTHVVAAGFDPNGVVHDAVHDGIGMYP